MAGGRAQLADERLGCRRWPALLRHRRCAWRRRRVADAGAGRAARPRGGAADGRRAGLRRARHPRLGRRARGGARARASSPPAATAVLGGVLPTPAVALRALDLGVVITASHNPPEYNGVKFFDADGPQALRRRRGADRGAARRARRRRPRARSSASRARPTRYLDYVLERFGSDLDGPAHRRRLRQRRLLGARARGVRAARRRGARDRRRARRHEHQHRLRRHRHRAACSGRSRAAASTSASPSTATATGCSPSTSTAQLVDGDQILAILALDLGVDLVAVTQMTNLGFHALMRERGIRVRHDRRRRPLRARGARGARAALLGGEQSGHVIYLRDHVTGDGLAAALLLCAALRGPRAERGRSGACRASRRSRRTSRVASKELTPAI